MSKVHFRMTLSGLPARLKESACGKSLRNRNILEVTDDVDEVTCGSCKRTEDYQFARTAQRKRERRSKK